MRIYKYITVVVFAAALTACGVEYYSSPNAAAIVPTSGIMNSVQKRLMDDTRDAWLSGRQTLLWVQYWGQINYTEEDRYQYRETVNEAAWNDLYGHAMDLKSIIELNTDEATKGDMEAYGPNENQIAAARIMLAYIFQLAANQWGDIPYYSYGSDDADFQGLSLRDNAVMAPVYASQSKIYADILKELDEAQAMINTSATMIEGDSFFDGDAVQWKKFANSLRLRIANRIKAANNSLATQHINAAISAGVMEGNDDSAGVTYTADNDANSAPMYSAFYISNRLDFAPSNTFVELLKGDRGPFGEDPRLGIYVDPNASGEYVGIPVGAARDVVSDFKWESLPGEAILDSKYTEYYMEYSEVCFLLSEVNGWDQDWYEAGVEASMEKWGVPAADIEAYIATLPAASEETVLTQKYIALYMQPQEAWAEYKRTGYPTTFSKPGNEYSVIVPLGDGTTTTFTYTFTTLVSGLTDLPTRANYPLVEANINSLNYKSAGDAIGGDEMDTKLWFQP
ncbi:SusD/RagB family nutrient-binding outer membrane lipoprotein [Carboxylicivirga caseinilyticus]|uniref:SusD/RagB family nutrient-binding outer membrane lipoprotein n=1 Tax=Carboxylicivirga caseinilyticus TaxID=3417572 RepID=UPI003D33D85B|nr:SusD/RagB family nutrient-binding outer membrane lipoprotein [Marinilabiliaceae bacterium A049]